MMMNIYNIIKVFWTLKQNKSQVAKKHYKLKLIQVHWQGK